MSVQGQIIATKIRLMNEQIKFLEYVWNSLSDKDQNNLLKDYLPEVPNKYK